MKFSKNQDLNSKAFAFISAYSKLKTDNLDLDEYNQVYVKNTLKN